MNKKNGQSPLYQQVFCCTRWSDWLCFYQRVLVVLASHAGVFRDEKRAPLKTPAIAWDQSPHRKAEPSSILGRGKEQRPQNTFRLASLAQFFFFVNADFFSFFPQCGAWSRANGRGTSIITRLLCFCQMNTFSLEMKASNLQIEIQRGLLSIY